jgi:hypothetical protein
MILRFMVIPLTLFATDLDHAQWDRMLKQYVTPQSLVNYSDWKKTAADLDRYLAGVENAWPAEFTPVQRKATLINAYNAHTVRWIVNHYPVESIWRTPKPFRTARHRVDGKVVSLDDIETALRKMGDPRVHAVLVCAARSCPPLRREAYVADRLDLQLDDNTAQWLANIRLNSFDPHSRTADVSPIFKWYRQDFGSLEKFLASHGPRDRVAFLTSPGATIKFKDYHWGLNDTSDLGRQYSGARFWWDYVRNK